MTTTERPQRAGALRFTGNIQGALWVLGAAVCFSVMATITKYLGQTFNSFEIAFFRALFGLFAVVPFVLRMGLGKLKTKRLGMHGLRGLLGTSAMMCGFYAFTHLSFADAVSLSYVRSLFLIPLAVLFLGEVVRRRRWAATAVGFIGVLVMLRPGGEIEFAAFVALGGALLVAVVTVLIKKLSSTERPETLLFYFGIISTPLALLPALAVWQTPGAGELGLLMAIGAIAASGQYCMIRGFASGEATAILPFDYSRLLFATGIGILIFAEIPDAWTIVGALIIVASTLYIALREAGLGKRPKPGTHAVNPPVLPQTENGEVAASARKPA